MSYVEAVAIALERMQIHEKTRCRRRGFAVIVAVCGPFWGAVLWWLLS